VLVGAVLKGAGIHALLSAAAFMIVVVGTFASIFIQTPLPCSSTPWPLLVGDQAAAGAGRRTDQEDRRVEHHRAQAGLARPGAAHRAGSRTRS
jgi:hypothetical protein